MSTYTRSIVESQIRTEKDSLNQCARLERRRRRIIEGTALAFMGIVQRG